MNSLFNIETLYKQENNFYNELINANVQDPVQLNLISRDITTKPCLQMHKIPFLKYLTLNTDRLLEKLSCINTYFMAYLADEQIQSIIFTYCFKIWDSGQDVFDAEIYHLLYSILERCKISENIWQQEFDKSNNGKMAKSLEMYDNMIEDYLFNPSDNYPTNLEPSKDINITVLARFTLFNVLYAKDMRPIHLINNELFELSDECIALLQQIDKSLFTIETKMIENALRNPEKHLPCYSMNQTIVNTNATTINSLEIVIRECCSLLIHAPMFVHTITLCLIHLTKFTDQHCTKLLYHNYITMCQAAWLKLLLSILNNLVFLNPQQSSYYTIMLSECCACMFQFHRYTDCKEEMDNFQENINKIWKDFLKKRLIYINSTGLEDDKLSWLQYLIITSSSTTF